jgi:hypothetical protein
MKCACVRRQTFGKAKRKSVLDFLKRMLGNKWKKRQGVSWRNRIRVSLLIKSY